MDHREAIQTLKDILPEITQAGDTGDALLKVASRSRWAPTQLEKVAFLYNTLRTVNFLDRKAGTDERGGSFSLLDVPDLVSRFVDSSVQQPTDIRTKLAGWFEDAAPAGQTTKAASYQPHHLPDFMHAQEPEPEITKAAAERDPAYASLEATRIKRANREQALYVQQVVEDFDQEIRANFRKLAAVRQHWGEVLQDMAGLLPDQYEKVAAAFDSYRASIGMKVNLAVEPDTRLVVWDRHNVEPVFSKAAEALECWEIAREQFGQVKQSTATATRSAPSSTSVLPKLPEGWDAIGSQMPLSSRIQTDLPQGQVNSLGITVGDLPSHGGPGVTGIRILEAPTAEQRGLLMDTLGRQREETVRGVGEMLDTGSGALRSTAQVMREVPDAADSAVQEHSTRLGQILDVLQPNTRVKQKGVDKAQMEARQQSLIQRLIIQDPIIRQANPATVLSLYDSLRYLDPEGSMDPNTVKLALREAIQYEGMPSHTAKDLADRRKSLEEAKSKEREGRTARYKV